MAQRDGESRPLSVLMVDIDNFKVINDTYGHETGDTVLIELARRLAGAVRGTDMVARWGGEEFVVLLRDCPLADAVTRAESIRRQIADVAGVVPHPASAMRRSAIACPSCCGV